MAHLSSAGVVKVPFRVADDLVQLGRHVWHRVVSLMQVLLLQYGDTWDWVSVKIPNGTHKIAIGHIVIK